MKKKGRKKKPGQIPVDNDNSLMISDHLPSLIGVKIVINMCTFSHFVLQSFCANSSCFS